jgi:hypothetical protein
MNGAEARGTLERPSPGCKVPGLTRRRLAPIIAAMTRAPDKPKPVAADERALRRARLAEALRANLRRRKAQSRAREEAREAPAKEKADRRES